MKPNIAVLASGNGSNLQAILDAIRDHKLNLNVTVVLSDRENAYALVRARERNVPAFFISPKNYSNRQKFEEAIIEKLKEHQTDWVILAGFMRIISPTLLEAYPNKILNIHPSLLPAFPGLNAIEQAWKYGVKITGCTVHLVDEGCDTGPILDQATVRIEPDDTLETLTEKIHREEHRLYPAVLKKLCEIRK